MYGVLAVAKQFQTSWAGDIPEVLLQFIVRSFWRQLKSQANPPNFNFVVE